MSQGAWRREVALLFEQCAGQLDARQDRQATAVFGTAIAYLQRAANEGDHTAMSLLAQAQSARCEDQTKRFSFSPGELEELTGRRLSK